MWLINESRSSQSHICVQQTAFDLLRRNYDVYVLSDAVSSCNKEEVTWALASMRQAGAQITTSESASYMLMGRSCHHHTSTDADFFFSRCRE